MFNLRIFFHNRPTINLDCITFDVKEGLLVVEIISGKRISYFTLHDIEEFHADRIEETEKREL